MDGWIVVVNTSHSRMAGPEYDHVGFSGTLPQKWADNYRRPSPNGYASPDLRQVIPQYDLSFHAVLKFCRSSQPVTAEQAVWGWRSAGA